jgi:hypothetical protein
MSKPTEAEIQTASNLRHAYNPLTTAECWPASATHSAERERWLAVAKTAQASSTRDREQLAAELHAIYVRAFWPQREHGWPPRSDDERERWLAVADAVLAVHPS